MAPTRLSGTEGYAEEADALVEQYEGIRFADLHGPILHLIPSTPCRVLDIGAGTGRDAAAFAVMQRCTAVMRKGADPFAKRPGNDPFR